MSMQVLTEVYKNQRRKYKLEMFTTLIIKMLFCSWHHCFGKSYIINLKALKSKPFGHLVAHFFGRE